MQKRLPFKNDFFQKCKAIFNIREFKIATWKSVAGTFKNIIPGEELMPLQFELERFESDEEAFEEAKQLKNNPIEFWFGFEKSYPLMSKLRLSLLTLTHFSACGTHFFANKRRKESSKDPNNCRKFRSPSHERPKVWR